MRRGGREVATLGPGDVFGEAGDGQPQAPQRLDRHHDPGAGAALHRRAAATGCAREVPGVPDALDRAAADRLGTDVAADVGEDAGLDVRALEETLLGAALRAHARRGAREGRRPARAGRGALAAARLPARSRRRRGLHRRRRRGAGAHPRAGRPRRPHPRQPGGPGAHLGAQLRPAGGVAGRPAHPDRRRRATTRPRRLADLTEHGAARTSSGSRPTSGVATWPARSVGCSTRAATGTTTRAPSGSSTSSASPGRAGSSPRPSWSPGSSASRTCSPRSVVEAGGRIIKTIGDEVLFVTDSPAAAAEVALAAARARSRPADDFPQVRAGVAYGEVVSRLGDVLGPTVNLAARLTSVARPGTVLVDRGAHDALRSAEASRARRRREGAEAAYADGSGFRLRRIPRTSVKGYSRLEAWAVRRRADRGRPAPGPREWSRRER